MIKALTLSMCLVLPLSAFAQDALPTPPPDAPAAAADKLSNPSLVPTDVAPVGATEGTRSCGMRYGCGGGRSKAKFVIVTSVIGTVLTAAAVGIAVGVSKMDRTNGQIPR